MGRPNRIRDFIDRNGGNANAERILQEAVNRANGINRAALDIVECTPANLKRYIQVNELKIYSPHKFGRRGKAVTP